MGLTPAQRQKTFRKKRKRDAKRYAAHRLARREYARRWEAAHRLRLKKEQPEEWAKRLAKRRRKARKDRIRNPAVTMIQWARKRAREKGFLCTITVADIFVPKRCPALGVPLSVGRKFLHAFSPTLDRINPSKGYVPGNVAVISHRANVIKNDATAKEILAVAKWVQSITVSKVFK